LSCILCFIDDDFQEKIRSFSQLKSERFEDILEHFKSNFLNELGLLENINHCETHKHFNTKTQKLAVEFHKQINELKDLELFFNSLIMIYLSWIKGNISKSKEEFRNLLFSKDIFQSTDKINNTIFFRGRKSQNLLTKDDIFHIPFNKRNQIGNQRYSISGQPVLYFGYSLIDIVFELNGKIDEIENLYFSSFLNKTDKKLKVLDLTNPFAELFSEYEILSNENTEFYNTYGRLDVQSNFYKFILIQFCTFKRKDCRNSQFSEEYVLPQLISQIVKDNYFDGILFSSSRFDNKVCFSKRKNYSNRYRENLALFTKYSEKEDYDKDLLNQFIISMPINIESLQDISLQELEELRSQIGKIVRRGAKPPFHLDITEISGTRTLTIFENVYINENQNEFKYFEHKIGKLHLLLVYNLVLEFRNQLIKTI
jgi:hypothetical protein